MIDGISLKEIAQFGMSRSRGGFEKLPLKGRWDVEHWRKNKHGELYLLNKETIFNDITTAGKNKLFDTMFNAVTQQLSTDWCAGLINVASFTGYNPADTMASHAGWIEWTAYSQTTRVAWTQGSASAAAIANSSPMIFDINGTGSVQGLFITTNNTKGGTTGNLWSAASYTSPVAVVPADQIRSTYSLSC